MLLWWRTLYWTKVKMPMLIWKSRGLSKKQLEFDSLSWIWSSCLFLCLKVRNSSCTCICVNCYTRERPLYCTHIVWPRCANPMFCYPSNATTYLYLVHWKFTVMWEDWLLFDFIYKQELILILAILQVLFCNIPIYMTTGGVAFLVTFQISYHI